MQEDKANHIAELRAKQEALDARRQELDTRYCEATREKDSLHGNARDLQRQVDSVKHDIIFANEAE